MNFPIIPRGAGQTLAQFEASNGLWKKGEIALVEGKILIAKSDGLKNDIQFDEFISTVDLDSKLSNLDFIKTAIGLEDARDGAMRFYGGKIEPNLDGTVNITAGKGAVHSTVGDLEGCACDENSPFVSPMRLVEWSAVSSLALADNSYNFIYFDGADDTIKATTDFYSIDFNTSFTIGRAFRSGNEVISRLCGTNAWAFDKRVQFFGEEYFPIVRAKGLLVSESGQRYLDMTAGVLWAELVNRFSIDSFTSNPANPTPSTFSTWYRDGLGGWTRTNGETQVSNTLWDNGSGTLATLGSASRYGVHWVYVVHDSTVHVVYGQGDYTLSNADIVAPPASLPGLLSSYATLVAKIIVQRGASNFTSVSNPFEQKFSTSFVAQHNDLSSLQGGVAGEYYHLTQTQLSQVSGLSASLAEKQNALTSIVTEEGADAFSVSSSHIQKYVRVNRANPVTITVEPNSLVSVSIGTKITFCQSGAGGLTLSAGSGVTLNSAAGLSTSSQFSVIQILKVDSDSWDVIVGATV